MSTLKILTGSSNIDPEVRVSIFIFRICNKIRYLLTYLYWIYKLSDIHYLHLYYVFINAIGLYVALRGRLTAFNRKN